jgi:hypothetical protein
LDDELLMSVDELLFVVDDVSLLVVPLAPMLEVLGLVELFAVLELLLGVVEELLLGVVEPVLLLGEVAVEPADGLVLLVVLFVDEALVPPEPELPELPPVCAIAKPPMASAAAAANVVSVFLVVVMSFAP